MDLTFTLSDLTLDEVNTLIAGLQELPARVANPLTDKIRKQAQAQLPAAAQAPAEAA